MAINTLPVSNERSNTFLCLLIGCFIGFVAWFLVRYLAAGFYTVNQNERAVKTIFGRAQRVSNLTTLDDPVSDALNPDEKTRYAYPQVRVIMPADRFFSAADALLVPKKRKPQLACPKAAIAGKFPHEYRSHQS